MSVKRKLLSLPTAFGFLIVVVAATTAITLENEHRAHKQAAARLQAIRAEVNHGVAEGASLEDVNQFLDANHWERSETVGPQAIREANGRSYDNTLMVIAIRRNTGPGSIIREDIQVVFVFDSNHKLMRNDVFPVYTGP